MYTLIFGGNVTVCGRQFGGGLGVRPSLLCKYQAVEDLRCALESFLRTLNLSKRGFKREVSGLNFLGRFFTVEDGIERAERLPEYSEDLVDVCEFLIGTRPLVSRDDDATDSRLHCEFFLRPTEKHSEASYFFAHLQGLRFIEWILPCLLPWHIEPFTSARLLSDERERTVKWT